MAPKRRPVNVVRSGNAGNSTKPKTEPVKEEGDDPPLPPPLFPPGYKTPISVLMEKCQKAGWEKPVIDSVCNICNLAIFSIEPALAEVFKLRSDRILDLIHKHSLDR